MAAPAEPEPTHDAKGRPFISMKALAKHTGRDDVWMSINGKVYNVSAYLEDHPGGEEVLIDNGGKEATEAFEDVGHSNEARKLLQTFEVGELPPSEKLLAASGSTGGGGGGSMGIVIVPLLAVVAGAGYYYYSQMM